MAATSPTGMSVQALYRLFREDRLFVNRKYQRKLVWTIEEKQALIDSIRHDYPVPLILLANLPGQSDSFEIVDGMQRLNAIFTFLENAFDVRGRYFDVNELARAKQLVDQGAIKLPKDRELLPRDECAQLLEYQLAVTVYPAPSEEAVWDVFRRINSNGRHLSPQETRQAGVLSSFADTVRRLAAEIRGDVSADVLLLSQMPSISVDSPRFRHGYGVRANETFWCRQGILLPSQLRDSEDEQVLADLAASMVLRKPLAASRELFDELYSTDSTAHRDLEAALVAYGPSRLKHEIRVVFSVAREIVESHSTAPNALRDQLRERRSGNPVKGPFYAFVMALHDLVVTQELSPVDMPGIMRRLDGVVERLKMERHYTTADDRQSNIDVVKGLIQPLFAHKQPPALRSGAGLVYDFENALRRSSIESGRYEFKQGLLNLDINRALNQRLLDDLPRILCALANSGPEADSFLFFGVADDAEDAARVEEIDNIKARQVGARYVVGIEREVHVLKSTIENYVRKVVSAILSSKLTDPCKTQVLAQIETIRYHGLEVIRGRVPAQTEPSYVGDDMYIRAGEATRAATAREAAAVVALFRRAGTPGPARSASQLTSPSRLLGPRS